MLELFIKKHYDTGSHEALKVSHTFSMDDSGVQTCLQHETHLFQYKTIGSEHMFTSLILLHLARAQVNVY